MRASAAFTPHAYSVQADPEEDIDDIRDRLCRLCKERSELTRPFAAVCTLNTTLIHMAKPSILEFGFVMVSSCSLDVMHLMDLKVAKHVIVSWLKGKVVGLLGEKEALGRPLRTPPI